MSDNSDNDQGFDSLVEDAMRELGSSVGSDKHDNSLGKDPQGDEIRGIQIRGIESGFSLDIAGLDLRDAPGFLPVEAASGSIKVVPDEAAPTSRRTRIRLDSPYTVWYGTNRKRVIVDDKLADFSSGQDTITHYGRVEVFIPKSHKIGSIGSNFFGRTFRSIRALRWIDDRLKFRAIEPFEEHEFWGLIRDELRSFEPNQRQAVVFIHGYNVSFKEAAVTAAQIGLDASVEVPMAFFSWPSQGVLARYTYDEDAIAESEKAIEDFLVKFAADSGASSIHVIAHSMGNRGLLRAVNSIYQKAQKRIFGQIILAAADVSTNQFLQLCAAYTTSADRTTLYVSRRDLAVEASRFIHGRPRIGLLPPLVVAPGIDTINVSGVNLSLLGHGYIANARPVVTDIQRLLRDGAHPDVRGLRQAKDPDGRTFWEIGA